MKQAFFPSATLGRSLLGLTLALVCFLSASQSASAYPVYAQTAYDNPREPTGRIVCANCHLGAKPTQVEVPQAVLPDTVFEAVVKIPYDKNLQQVLGDGSKGPLNVGAVLMLPPGFKIAPPDRLSPELQEKTDGLYFQSYSPDQENIVVVGPVPGDQYQEITFPVLSPDPQQQKGVYFGKYPIHVGGNRGRGQLYPTGDKSNNGVFNASVAGQVTQVTPLEEGGYAITLETASGASVVDNIPAGPELAVAAGDTVAAGAPLTNNPNVGGFGQADTEIVLQDPNRINWLVAFFGAVMLSQVMLILKKKQVERVQAAEMNF